MKFVKIMIAAVLALGLSACSIFHSPSEKQEQTLPEGTYSCEVSLSGGSGKSTVESPATVMVADAKKTIRLVWSSSHYDYMLVEGAKYVNEAAPGSNSTFTIPFHDFGEAFAVIGDTTAMSTPHEIEYRVTVYAPGEKADTKEEARDNKATDTGEYSLGDLIFSYSMKTEYATGFSVDYYRDDRGNKYAFLYVRGVGEDQYFLKPLEEAPSEMEGLSDNVTVLKDPDRTYLVSTSVMDLILHIDGLSHVKFSGTDAKDWYLEEAANEIKNGNVLYAGKYSAPDYELLVTEGCDLAIENTMIYHNPEVKEKLESLGIPVLVETSSYESSPLGRLEWIKLYGVLFDQNDLAAEVFTSQTERTETVLGQKDTGRSVAFFSVTSNGQIVIRKKGDYISSMIEMAGGHYVPEDTMVSEDALSTTKITMEDFYLEASDADILIYNSTIEGEPDSVEDMTKPAPALADFQAVKEHNVYCLREGYFQKTTEVAEFIEELHEILTGSFESGQCFYRLKE